MPVVVAQPCGDKVCLSVETTKALALWARAIERNIETLKRCEQVKEYDGR
jgi:hypothetical protein